MFRRETLTPDGTARARPPFRTVGNTKVVSWDSWAPVEAGRWIFGRAHGYPEHFAAGLKPHAVTDKYYLARRPEIRRIVDISHVVDKKVEANRANVAKGPAGTNGSRLRAELAKRNLQLPLSRR